MGTRLDAVRGTLKGINAYPTTVKEQGANESRWVAFFATQYLRRLDCWVNDDCIDAEGGAMQEQLPIKLLTRSTGF